MLQQVKGKTFDIQGAKVKNALNLHLTRTRLNCGWFRCATYDIGSWGERERPVIAQCCDDPPVYPSQRLPLSNSLSTSPWLAPCSSSCFEVSTNSEA
jgi:hypothetical protein